jgi:hypothetical protein
MAAAAAVDRSTAAAIARMIFMSFSLQATKWAGPWLVSPHTSVRVTTADILREGTRVAH